MEGKVGIANVKASVLAKRPIRICCRPASVRGAGRQHGSENHPTGMDAKVRQRLRYDTPRISDLRRSTIRGVGRLQSVRCVYPVCAALLGVRPALPALAGDARHKGDDAKDAYDGTQLNEAP